MDSIGLDKMPWFTAITEFMESSMEDSGKEDSSDKKVLSAVINKTVVPRLTGNLNSVIITNTLLEMWRCKEILYVFKSNRFQIDLVGKRLFVQILAVHRSSGGV